MQIGYYKVWQKNQRKEVDKMNDKIIIKGAKEHNLKNINLEIPRDKLVVITGLSGSGMNIVSTSAFVVERLINICGI